MCELFCQSKKKLASVSLQKLDRYLSQNHTKKEITDLNLGPKHRQMGLACSHQAPREELQSPPLFPPGVQAKCVLPSLSLDAAPVEVIPDEQDARAIPSISVTSPLPHEDPPPQSNAPGDQTQRQELSAQVMTEEAKEGQPVDDRDITRENEMLADIELHFKTFEQKKQAAYDNQPGPLAPNTYAIQEVDIAACEDAAARTIRACDAFLGRFTIDVHDVHRRFLGRREVLRMRTYDTHVPRQILEHHIPRIEQLKANVDQEMAGHLWGVVYCYKHPNPVERQHYEYNNECAMSMHNMFGF